MKSFKKEFEILKYVVDHGERFLVMAHKRPDPDTVGAAVALSLFLKSLGKHVDIVCLDSFPEFLDDLVHAKFLHPKDIDLPSYDVLIGADSVERGFTDLIKNRKEHQVTVFLDHHLDTPEEADVTIIDPEISSTCEIVYHFFGHIGFVITPKIATALLVGILGDTGNLQHSNTSSRVIEISEDLTRKGASPGKIVEQAFADKKLSTLNLWGRAIEKAQINEKNDMIVSALTKDDLAACNATTEDVKHIASLLITVPNVRFSLFLFQAEENTIKGSLRSEIGRDTNVSDIARKLGGGGHKLASGFELPGKILETQHGWEVV